MTNKAMNQEQRQTKINEILEILSEVDFLTSTEISRKVGMGSAQAKLAYSLFSEMLGNGLIVRATYAAKHFPTEYALPLPEKEAILRRHQKLKTKNYNNRSQRRETGEAYEEWREAKKRADDAKMKLEQDKLLLSNAISPKLRVFKVSQGHTGKRVWHKPASNAKRLGVVEFMA